MNKEVKGVLVFGSILLLVLAGFYVSYISLKENLPEGETFTTFVGNAMKQFSRADTKVQQEKYKITRAEAQRKSKVGEIVEALALDSCFKNSCYDTDGGENFNLKGKVYVRKGYQETYTQLYPVKTIDGKKYQCIPTDDYCKDNYIIEQSCGNVANPIKTTLKECPCGCASGVCIPCPPAEAPDLVVKSIAKAALSEQCLNSFTFTICNEGDADINNEFPLTVEANKVKKEYLVKANKFPDLVAGGCSNIVVPGLFSIGGFGLDLNQNTEVIVTLDTTNVIDEQDEANNVNKETVSTGDAYYYNENLKCDTYCYETDAGKDYLTQGTMSYKYSGYISKEEDSCPTWDLNQVVVNEQYCKLPIILKTNGKFSNPANGETYNCLDQVPPKRCDTGKCVPLSVTCEDAYGNLGPCLQCIDYEGPESDPTQYQNLEQYSLDKNMDPFVKGTIDYTSIDNAKSKIKDECLSTELLTDYICTEYNKYPLVDNPKVNCYKLKTLNGQGHVCIEGRCVALNNLEFKDGQMCQLDVDVDACKPIPAGINSDLQTQVTPDGKKQICTSGNCVLVETGFEQCVGPTQETTDPFKQEKIVETKLLGETESQEDYCTNYGDTVVEFFCEGNYYSSKATNCDALLDKNGKGASCVKGKCQFFDESLLSCKENMDSGIDTEKQGYVEYTTGYGFSDSKSDDCLSEDTLIETYCSGKEIVIYEHSCKDEGKICVNGACKTPNLVLMQCTDTEQVNGKVVKDKTIAGEIKGIDQFGNGYYFSDKCGKYTQTELASNKVIERYCENNQFKEIELTCDKGTLCNDGKCVFADESLKSCKVDEKNQNMAYVTDIFGTPETKMADCNGQNPSAVNVPICVGNQFEYQTKPCSTGFECKWNWENGGTCVKVDYNLEKCEETSTGAVITDKWGGTSKPSNWCLENGNLNKPICVSKEQVDYVETACGDGKACNPQKNACDTVDLSKVSCTYDPATKQGEYTDKFGNTYSLNQWCGDSFSVKQEYCDGKEKKEKTTSCAVGEQCNFDKGQCQKVDLNKVSCSGPTQPNFNKKEKVIAYNEFGEQVTEDGFFEDICAKDVEADEPANLIAEFWCEGTEMEVNLFECPSGKTCQAGACV